MALALDRKAFIDILAYHRADKAIQHIVDLLAASPLRGNCRTLFVYDSPS
jgi:hypothetical protein